MRPPAAAICAGGLSNGVETMADTNITAKLRGGEVQNTGKPVFDATVNVAMAAGICDEKTLRQIHATLLELYSKEPGSEHWNAESEATKD